MPLPRSSAPLPATRSSATHHAATLFWAVLFERFIQLHPDRRGNRLLGEALIVSAVASAVDYGATPKRFTPGWELVLTKRSMAAVYGAMALGLAAGGPPPPRAR